MVTPGGTESTNRIFRKKFKCKVHKNYHHGQFADIYAHSTGLILFYYFPYFCESLKSTCLHSHPLFGKPKFFGCSI